ncbi:T9SS type A sorting domain-containing protein [Telluribacter humicola]|uniref:T9SS type A sorting domain-containing protein n=1 Tax=Telluribacter humicola TaxID=1720261 RepID=UPI001A957C71|nr:T9SS type A sorting domain-containing protein [Telluribacter humicola]
MKKRLYQTLLVSALLLGGLSLGSEVYAQSKEGKKEEKKTTIRVKVSEKKDGRTEESERSYRVGAMSDQERKEFVDKVLDSLGTNTNRRVTVMVDEGDGNITTRERRRVEVRERNDDEPAVFSWRDNDDDFHIEFDSKEMKEKLRRIEEEVRPRVRVMMRDLENAGERMGDIWTSETGQPASVRSLNVYPNNPNNGMLNLRFSVPQKGDVTITVTDTRGKEVAQKEIRDFSGEYVGQIELKKNTKGTLFVTVVQNEDGVVRRVVIP